MDNRERGVKIVNVDSTVDILTGVETKLDKPIKLEVNIDGSIHCRIRNEETKRLFLNQFK